MRRSKNGWTATCVMVGAGRASSHSEGKGCYLDGSRSCRLVEKVSKKWHKGRNTRTSTDTTDRKQIGGSVKSTKQEPGGRTHHGLVPGSTPGGPTKTNLSQSITRSRAWKTLHREHRIFSPLVSASRSLAALSYKPHDSGGASPATGATRRIGVAKAIARPGTVWTLARIGNRYPRARY